jgi:DNA-nicking Smr family endonuclease
MALWQVATKDASPLTINQAASTKPRLRIGDGRGFSGPSRPLPSVPARRFYPDATKVDPLTESTPGLDRKTAKSLKKGERAPEARVDLHGMTLEAAHDALGRFIRAEYARGARCVLVITGKGGDYRGRAIGYGDGRGALKRDVPRWLREPGLAGAVVGIYQAHKRHGGEGALYVYLKKPR